MLVNNSVKVRAYSSPHVHSKILVVPGGIINISIKSTASSRAFLRDNSLEKVSRRQLSRNAVEIKRRHQLGVSKQRERHKISYDFSSIEDKVVL